MYVCMCVYDYKHDTNIHTSTRTQWDSSEQNCENLSTNHYVCMTETKYRANLLYVFDVK